MAQEQHEQQSGLPVGVPHIVPPETSSSKNLEGASLIRSVTNENLSDRTSLDWQQKNSIEIERNAVHFDEYQTPTETVGHKIFKCFEGLAKDPRVIPGYGIYKDLVRRVPWYFSDVKDGLHYKTITTIILLFFTSIAPAISLGAYLDAKTGRQMGIEETLLSTTICGMVWSLFAGQPMLIIGVTGPVAIFTYIVLTVSEQFQIPFIPWISCIGVFSSIMHFAVAIFNLSSLIKYVSRFTVEIFAILTGVLLIESVVEDLVKMYLQPSSSVAATLLTTLIVLGTCFSSLKLDRARNWKVLPKAVTAIIADNAVVISVLVFTAVAYIPTFAQVPIHFLTVPDSFQPIVDRSWLVSWGALSWAQIGSAILPAIILTILFFFDQNVCSLLAQRRELNLKKGSGYHWDFFVLGVIMLIQSLLGLPFTNALIPNSPLHVKAMSTMKEMRIEETGAVTEVYENVRENRVTGFVQALLIGVVMIWGSPILKLIPTGIVMGLFVFMGVTSCYDNQFTDRMKLMVTRPSHYGAFFDQYPLLKIVGIKTIFIFTIIQIVCLIMIIALTLSPLSLLFPFFILVLIPFRKFLLRKIFGEAIELLDGDEPVIPAQSSQGSDLESSRTSAASEPHTQNEVELPHMDVSLPPRMSIDIPIEEKEKDGSKSVV